MQKIYHHILLVIYGEEEHRKEVSVWHQQIRMKYRLRLLQTHGVIVVGAGLSIDDDGYLSADVQGGTGQQGPKGDPGVTFYPSVSDDGIISWSNNGGLNNPDPVNLKLNTTYVHTQDTASATWFITHNLNKYPAITVVDSAGSIVVGEVKYINSNEVQIYFNGAFSGKAYINQEVLL